MKYTLNTLGLDFTYMLLILDLLNTINFIHILCSYHLSKNKIFKI